jgi:hypothetical protein
MKQTGTIENKPDSIALAKRGLWFTAAEKLHESAIGIEQMTSAENRVDYESGWIRFVDSIQEFWVSFVAEVEMQFSKLKPWVVKFTRERKRDPLLKYLYQARHQSQHAVLPIEWEESCVQIAPGFYGHLKNLEINSNGDFEVDANPLGSVNNQVKLVHNPGNPLLPVIENKKYNQAYEPPTEHLGSPIGRISPLNASQLAYNYYSSVLKAAIKKFEKQQEASSPSTYEKIAPAFFEYLLRLKQLARDGHAVQLPRGKFFIRHRTSGFLNKV